VCDLTGTPDSNIVTGTSYEYDTFGQLTTVIEVVRQGAATQTVSSLMDSNGTSAWPDARPKTHYEYDEAGRLWQERHEFISLNDSTPAEARLQVVVTEREFDALDRVVVTEQYSYSSKDNAPNTPDPNSLSEIATFQNEYDAAGRKVRSIETSADVSGVTYEWSYDAAGRLLAELRFDREFDDNFDRLNDVGSARTTYQFDLVGNRLEKREYLTHVFSSETTYSYDENDRLDSETTSIGPNDETTTYNYDFAGLKRTQLHSVTSAGTTNYEYNLQGRLSKITEGSLETEMKYDVNGIRVSRKEILRNGETVVSQDETTFLNDANNPTGYSQVINQRDGADLLSFTLGIDVISQHDAAFPPDPSDPTKKAKVIKEEARTVGFPPHDKEPYSENKIRDEWDPKQPQRPYY